VIENFDNAWNRERAHRLSTLLSFVGSDPHRLSGSLSYKGSVFFILLAYE
jgi:hypothetical protein